MYTHTSPDLHHSRWQDSRFNILGVSVCLYVWVGGWVDRWLGGWVYVCVCVLNCPFVSSYLLVILYQEHRANNFFRIYSNTNIVNGWVDFSWSHTFLVTSLDSKMSANTLNFPDVSHVHTNLHHQLFVNVFIDIWICIMGDRIILLTRHIQLVFVTSLDWWKMRIILCAHMSVVY